MIKSTAVTLLAGVLLTAGSLLGRSCGAAARRADPSRLEHTIRAFGYELSVRAHLSTLGHAGSSSSDTVTTCAARVDTVFVLVLPTAVEAGGGS
ncbi:MAG: hypothetical protein PVF27_01450 [Gemmatimonadales bacterium]|jgi:hypothetical protein